MLDLVIRGGQVILPDGVGAWDVGIEGERIAAIALPGTLPTDSARVIDASGKIVTPGGVEPHAHLAHGIMSHPEAPSMTLGPEDDTVGMACGGTTTHVDFAYVRPGSVIRDVVEQRAARWKGNSYIDYTFHITLAGALELSVFDQIPEAIQSGYPSFKVFTTNVLPPHPKRAGNRLDFGRIHYAMEKVAPAGGIMVVHGEDEDLVQFNYERFREEKRMAGENLHLVHTKLSESLAFARTIALARATGVGVYFVHTSAREGVEAIQAARAQGLPVYGETLHQYACFNAEYYKTPRGFCSHTYPSLKLPEDQAALWNGLVVNGLSTLATDEYPTNLELKLRGKTIEDVTGGNLGAEARMGIGYTRGRGQARHVPPPLRRHHGDQCREDLRALSEEGGHRPRQRRRHLRDRSRRQEDALARGLPRERLQPVGGLGGLGLADHDAPARQGHCRARQAARCPDGWAAPLGAAHRGLRARPSGLLSAAMAQDGGRAADYAAQFNPGFALDPARAALVVVDMQYASGARKAGLGRLLAEQGNEAQGAYRFDRIEGVVVPTIAGLLEFFRARALRVVYLTVGSELPDYSDLLPHMRGMAEQVGNTRGRREHDILDELAPQPGEAVLNKTTMSAFHSSGFERLVRSWGMEQLLFTGISTNSCVEGTARDAADRGFRCLLVEDGCGAASQKLHDAACENFQRLLGRVAPSAAVMSDLADALTRA